MTNISKEHHFEKATPFLHKLDPFYVCGQQFLMLKERKTIYQGNIDKTFVLFNKN